MPSQVSQQKTSENEQKKYPFFVHFQTFLLISAMKSLKKVLNEQKRLKTVEKKYFGQI